MSRKTRKEIESLETKDKVDLLIKEYVDLFPGEYEQFKKGQGIKKAKHEWNTFAETQGMEYVERILHEIPETLFSIFKLRLSKEEQKWLLDTKEGSRWLAKKYPVFIVSQKV